MRVLVCQPQQTNGSEGLLTVPFPPQRKMASDGNNTKAPTVSKRKRVGEGGVKQEAKNSAMSCVSVL